MDMILLYTTCLIFSLSLNLPFVVSLFIPSFNFILFLHSRDRRQVLAHFRMSVSTIIHVHCCDCMFSTSLLDLKRFQPHHFFPIKEIITEMSCNQMYQNIFDLQILMHCLSKMTASQRGLASHGNAFLTCVDMLLQLKKTSQQHIFSKFNFPLLKCHVAKSHKSLLMPLQIRCYQQQCAVTQRPVCTVHLCLPIRIFTV